MTQSPESPMLIKAAWTGSELKTSTEWLYQLSEAEIEEIETELQRVKRLMKVQGKSLLNLKPDDFQYNLILKAATSWTDALRSGLGFIQIKGWPAADYSEAENSLVYWSLGLLLGAPVPQNTDGDLLGHIRDTGADPDDPSIRLYKTRVRQDFHADGSDIISLMCLHPSKSGGESQLVSSVTIFNEVLRRRPDLAPLMFEPFYFDLHEQQSEGEKPYWVMPISTYTDAGLRTWFAEWYIRMAQRHDDVPRLTEAQDQLINLIVEIANDPDIHIDINFETGDMQFLKNAAILHARGEYEDYEDPSMKRHLLRLWLARSDFEDGDVNMRSGVKTDKAA